MIIAIGNDHAAVTLKNTIVEHLKSKGHEVLDLGIGEGEKADYPLKGEEVAMAVVTNKADLGIAICGSANGITMTVNKHQGCRAAICWEPELAALARQHNNANVLSLPARFISEEKALEIVKTFFANDFEGGRHARRVEKIAISAE